MGDILSFSAAYIAMWRGYGRTRGCCHIVSKRAQTLESGCKGVAANGRRSAVFQVSEHGPLASESYGLSRVARYLETRSASALGTDVLYVYE